MYPKTQPQTFSVSVRFEAEFSGWSIEDNLTASAMAPNHEFVGQKQIYHTYLPHVQPRAQFGGHPMSPRIMVLLQNCCTPNDCVVCTSTTRDTARGELLALPDGIPPTALPHCVEK